MNERHPIPLSVDALMARSRQVAAVDIVDEEIVEPLRILHRSLCEEAHLHEAGATAMQDKLLRLLANRLRMQRDFASHPEIADEPIEAPVFVLGMARSGTTKTQKILAASGDFNYLPFWMNYHPALLTGSRDESLAVRIRESEEWCRWFDASSPEAKLGHPFEAHEPEEQTVLIEGCFRTAAFFGFCEVPSYLQWAVTQSARPMFEFLRDSLRYLQWQGLGDRSKRWLIKSPVFYGLERELLAVFPDAKIVMTHRSPLQTLPSMIKLVECFHRPYDNAPVSAAWFKMGTAMTLNLHLDLRMQGVIAPLDLRFEELHGDLESAIAKIYDFAGMRLNEAARDRMRHWEVEHPMHKAGRFNYSLEEYGFDPATIRADFARYLTFMDNLQTSEEKCV
jgi:Sulfotransferase family